MITISEISCSILIGSPIAQVRRRWKQALKDNHAVVETAEFSDLKTIVVKLKPSVVLFHLALTTNHKVSNVMTIRHLSPSSKIIVLTEVSDEKEQVTMLEIGGKGYCNIDIDPMLLRKAVQVVQKGEIWVGRNVISSLIQKLAARRESLQKVSFNDAVHLNCLTPRERQIASMVGNAASNKQIAMRLGITEATVKCHLTDIFRKLGIIDRLELALLISSREQRENIVMEGSMARS